MGRNACSIRQMFLDSDDTISAHEYWEGRLKYNNEEHARELKAERLIIKEFARLIVANAIQNGICIYCKQTNISHKQSCPTIKAFNHVN